MIGFDLLFHLGLDLLEILGRDAVAEFHVVVKAVLDRRTGSELGVGPEAQDGRGEHVGAGMADALQLGHFVPVVGSLVFHKWGSWAQMNLARRGLRPSSSSA